MKGMIDMSCASQAATSIRRFTSMDEGSSSVTTVRLGGGGGSNSGRAIDRYNPIIRDASRIGKLAQNTPLSSEPTHHKNSRKKKIASSSKENKPNHHPKKIINNISSSAAGTKQVINDEKRKSILKKSSWSCTNPGEFFSPPGSSRYLLTSTDHQKSVNLPDFDPLLQLPPPPPPPPPLLLPSKPKPHHQQSSSAAALPPTSSSSRQVVVVLRVSLHCRGCERKMRKHLSRMEGVTSFDIDFIAKKLTVVGDVTPLDVLASVSKVKNAQLLTLPPSSSAPSQINRDLAIVV